MAHDPGGVTSGGLDRRANGAPSDPDRPRMEPCGRGWLDRPVTEPTPELHVRPHSRTGQWLVTVAGDATLSCHETADAAARRARSEASARCLPCIYVHDRYHRVRAVPAPVAGVRG